MHFREQWIHAENEATPISYLDQLDFKVVDQGRGTSVAYLVTENHEHRKRVSVFFLPQIEVGKDLRTIKTTSCWPGMLNRLLKNYEEDWNFPLKSRGTVSELDAKFLFHADIGKINCEIIGKRTGTDKLVPLSELNMEGWRYTVKDAPAEGSDYVLRFEIERQPNR